EKNTYLSAKLFMKKILASNNICSRVSGDKVIRTLVNTPAILNSSPHKGKRIRLLEGGRSPPSSRRLWGWPRRTLSGPPARRTPGPAIPRGSDIDGYG